MFTYHAQIFLHHTDAAGRIFFANQFYLMHEAKEKLFEKIGLPIQELLAHPEITLPIVHAESDYKSVLVAGDNVSVEVGVEKIGETSVIFAFNIKNLDGTLAGTGKTVCVCMNTETQKKVAIPKDWREKLSKALI